MLETLKADLILNLILSDVIRVNSDVNDAVLKIGIWIDKFVVEFVLESAINWQLEYFIRIVSLEKMILYTKVRKSLINESVMGVEIFSIKFL